MILNIQVHFPTAWNVLNVIPRTYPAFNNQYELISVKTASLPTKMSIALPQDMTKNIENKTNS